MLTTASIRNSVTSGHSMKNAVNEALHFAMEFWRLDSVRPIWEQGGWSLHPLTPIMGSQLQIAVLGPATGGKGSRADVFAYRPKYSPPPIKDDLMQILEENFFVSMSSETKRGLAKYTNCKLFWPGTRHTELWARAQLAIFFLQRDWVRSQDDESWIWEQCICPIFRLSRAGERALCDGSLGYEVLQTIVTNYVNPRRQNSFRSYMRTIANRIQMKSHKRVVAEESRENNAPDLVREGERFLAFARQRRHRGSGPIQRKAGRLVASKEDWTKLFKEWKKLRSRRAFVEALDSRMVQAGAKESSGRRQIRRWLRQADSQDGVIARFQTWQTRKRGISSRSSSRRSRH